MHASPPNLAAARGPSLPSPGRRLPRGAFVAAFAAFVAVAFSLAFPCTASALPAGPFDVEGPADAYRWDGATLSITGEGVTVAGMADPSGQGDVTVASEVAGVAIGEGVRIGTLDVGKTTAFTLDGEGNAVGTWKSSRGDSIDGTGSIEVDDVTAGLDVHDKATLRVAGDAYSVSVWEQGTLAMGPEARIGFVTVYDGTLDLSEIPIGSPVAVGGMGLGAYDEGVLVIAPFGATDFGQLVATPSLIVHEDSVPVREAGELIGAMRPDGSFDVTATRTVAFLGFDGLPVSVEKVVLFTAASAPEVSAPDGYRFVGWDRPFDYVTQDLSVAALFERLPAPQPPSAEGTSSASRGSVPATRFRESRAGSIAKTGDAAFDSAAVAGAAVLGSAAATGFAASRAHRRRR